MARIEDEIGKIADPVLRTTLFEEVKKLKAEKRFGLVFEEHLPELVPVYSAQVTARSTVARRGRTFNETFRVVRVHDGLAEVEKDDGKRESIPVEELTVVRRFGEPIYPALRPFDRVKNGDASQSHHILIEADNYHALQLLEYCYSGKVDCIYIDPPYNTGAKDWKYNNDYVDGNDTWRHSKWLSMMSKRLELAKRLLKPDTGVLIVTIDEHEFTHLGCLLDKEFPEARIQMVTIVNNAAGVSQGGFYRVEEYAFFCFMGNAKPVPIADDMLSDFGTEIVTPYWFSLIRYGGINALPSKRAGLVYPIAIDPETCRIVKTGKTLKARLEQGEEIEAVNDWCPEKGAMLDGYPLIWPFRGTGKLSTWQLGPDRLLELAKEGFVRIRPQKNGPGGNQWSINYVKSGNQKKVRDGEIPILGREDSGAYILGQISRCVIPKTVWRRAKHDAGKWGSRSLREILGDVSFDYAKSPYAVMDCLATVIGDKPNSITLDFFSGSGTTLQAISLLNNKDDGHRQCILVTNNEVPENVAVTLKGRDLQPGTKEWEDHGICQSVTFPRSKYTMLGRRNDDSELEGDYLTGRMVTKEKPRKFKQLGFVEGCLLTLEQRKQLVALVDKVPKSKITTDMPFFVDGEIPASILFDIRQADAWLVALEDQEHIADFYIATQENKTFNAIKQQIQNLLGPVLVEEEERRPLKDGFPANLEYFKLDFLDPTEVQMGRQFAAILPVLWMMAGARGPLPDAPDSHAHWLIPTDCPFAVLIQERRFKDFHRHIEGRVDLTHIFIVTDSRDTYHRLREEVNAPNVVQLYKDYLENFKINFGKD